MRTVSDRLRNLEEKYLSDKEAILAEAKVAEGVPMEPEMVHFASKPEPWVRYKVETVDEGLVILRLFPPPMPGHCVKKDGTKHVGPFDLNRAGNNPIEWTAEELIIVRLDGGRGFNTHSFHFWTPLPENKIGRISIEVERWPWKARPLSNIRYDAHGNVMSGSFSFPDVGQWKTIKWGTGSPDSYHFSLIFNGRERFITWLTDLDVASFIQR